MISVIFGIYNNMSQMNPKEFVHNTYSVQPLYIAPVTPFNDTPHKSSDLITTS